jgi:tripartite-type tricarboxylate transporter receptor subunit TctC
MRTFAQLAVSLTTLLASPGMIFAQDYPTRVIKLIVPYPAGGGVDNLRDRWRTDSLTGSASQSSSKTKREQAR